MRALADTKKQTERRRRQKAKSWRYSIGIQNFFVKAYDEGYKSVTVSISDAATFNPKPQASKNKKAGRIKEIYRVRLKQVNINEL